MNELFIKLKKIHSVYYVFLCLIGIWIFFFVREKYLLNDCHKYVIAKYDNFLSVGRTGKNVIFIYEYLGNTYKITESAERDLRMERIKEGYVFVKITCEITNAKQIIWDKPVPFELINKCPPNGWKEIPYGLALKNDEKATRSWWDKILHP
jgi:hypothetical protein